MLGLGWLYLRQAQDALKNGLLDDALRLLNQPAVKGNKRGGELVQQLGGALIERGERHLRQEDPVAAWNDLIKVEQLGLTDVRMNQLRQALTRLGLAEMRALLEAGEPSRAAEVGAQLRERGVRQVELEPMEEAAKDWAAAIELAERGEFAQAGPRIERARRLLPDCPTLDAKQREVSDREAAVNALLLSLHGAAAEKNWREVLALAERILTLAPQHAETRRVRGQAWKSLEPPTLVTSSPRRKSEEPAAAPNRFLLWIDGIGGYLICLDNRVTFGQASVDANVDVPIFAELSRHHATLTRDAEGYLLEGLRTIQVNGKQVDKATLRHSDRVTLGSSCQFQFLQPVGVSASARLDIVSKHRLRLAVDGVLLMADTLVLGPGTKVHVSVPDLKENVVLYRQKDAVGIRCPGNFTINGQAFRDRGVLEPGALAAGENFSLTLEAVGKKMA